jgi:hypothetical protein
LIPVKEKGADPHLIALEAVESPATNKREPTPEREPFTCHPGCFQNFDVSKAGIKANSFSNMLKNRKSI